VTLRANPIPDVFFFASFSVVMPMTSPREFTNGPPLLSGLIHAFV
jgi:hypothetical protein